MSEEHSLLSNPMLWYSAACAIFMYFAVKLGGKPVVGVLDAEIAKIRDELENARQLRAEAAATLADCREEEKKALAEASRIVTQAKMDAVRLHHEAEEEIRKTLERNEQKALQRIAAAEKEAMVAVKAEIIHQAVTAAQKALAEKIDAETQARVAEKAVAEVISFAPAVKGKIA